MKRYILLSILFVALNAWSQVETGSTYKTRDFVNNSVLASGDWYRLSTDETGIYRITYEDLEAMGISPASLDPRKIRLFGNGNGIVPEKNSVARYDDLIENAIYVHGEDDGIFNEGDYILFYGMSPIEWTYVPFQNYKIFTHKINHYEDHTYYFLNVGQENGKRVQSVDNSSLTPSVYVNEFSDDAGHESLSIAGLQVAYLPVKQHRMPGMQTGLYRRAENLSQPARRTAGEYRQRTIEQEPAPCFGQ